MKTFKTTAWPVITYIVEIPEDEARTKICCGPQGCGVVRETLEMNGRFCLGSMCMAWRWGSDLIERGESMWIVGFSARTNEGIVGQFCDERYDPPVPAENFKPAGNGWELGRGPDSKLAFWQRPAGRRGYCGWVGRDEPHKEKSR